MQTTKHLKENTPLWKNSNLSANSITMRFKSICFHWAQANPLKEKKKGINSTPSHSTNLSKRQTKTKTASKKSPTNTKTNNKISKNSLKIQKNGIKIKNKNETVVLQMIHITESKNGVRRIPSRDEARAPAASRATSSLWMLRIRNWERKDEWFGFGFQFHEKERKNEKVLRSDTIGEIIYRFI